MHRNWKISIILITFVSNKFFVWVLVGIYQFTNIAPSQQQAEFDSVYVDISKNEIVGSESPNSTKISTKYIIQHTVSIIPCIALPNTSRVYDVNTSYARATLFNAWTNKM